ncbi:MAG TPA: molybdopterin oxidoreductase family protein [Burkholderiales bacterium]|jgi:anaerobic selenocysteine-containing dehydrogenase|nr:molybdopterin oxidoreductase family protein [Burkholderiales bacterium]
MSSALSNPQQRVVKAACPHDCPDTCAMHITVEGETRMPDGSVLGARAVKVAGDAAHPTTAGVLCNKVARYLDRTYAADRLLHPMQRVGPKGPGARFEPISWEQALDTITARFKAIAADNPQSILPYSYAGTMGIVQANSIDRRFFHKLGASLLDRTICSNAGKAGMEITIGGNIGLEMERFDEARLILLWGTNPITSSVHLWTRVTEAKRRGAKVIAIDPYRSLSAEKCHQWLPINPGTDAALALAMMHVLVRDDLLDHDYIARYTLGFEQLKERVAQWPPERAAKITGLKAADIESLARDYGTASGENGPAAIRINYGLQRTAGGAMSCRTIACLPALTGAWRHAAGGVLLGTGATYPVNVKALERPDLIWNKPRTINMSTLGDALLELKDPPVRALYVYSSNPAAVAPESGKVFEGLMREDLFTVVHDCFLTDTCDYADIVLPATTQLEHFDIHKSYGHLYWLVNHPAIAPVGESKSDSEVFRLLAARMGFTEPCLFDSDEEIAAVAIDTTHPYNEGITFEKLKERGWMRLNVPERWMPFAEGNFRTPSGKCEFYSEKAKKLGLDPLPDFIAPRESPQSNPTLADKYPLMVISPPARNFMNSTFGNIKVLADTEKEPFLDMHEADAQGRGIADGAMVRIFNGRGAFLARARVRNHVRPGVVAAISVWWHKKAPGGLNANAVTSQALTDLGRGPTFYDCLVEVEPAAEAQA